MAENSWHRHGMKKLRHCHLMYTVSGKIEPLYFASNFAKFRPIFKILSPADLAVNF